MQSSQIWSSLSQFGSWSFYDTEYTQRTSACMFLTCKHT